MESVAAKPPRLCPICEVKLKPRATYCGLRCSRAVYRQFIINPEKDKRQAVPQPIRQKIFDYKFTSAST